VIGTSNAIGKMHVNPLWTSPVMDEGQYSHRFICDLVAD